VRLPPALHHRPAGESLRTSARPRSKHDKSRVDAHADARRGRMRFSVGRVLVINTPRSNRRTEEEDEIQLRSSARYQ
jgi:hypothetical protein